MTEMSLRAMKEFDKLPIYDEDDEAGCQSLLRVNDIRYEGAISEAEDESHFGDLLSDSHHNLKGAIKYSDSDVRAIFWLKRESQ